jgi:hypothetical protein
MAREKYQTRLPADMAEKVDEYKDENDISQAEAVRRLVESGLEAQNEPDDETDDEIERAAQKGTIYFLILVGLLSLNLVVTLGVI